VSAHRAVQLDQQLVTGHQVAGLCLSQRHGELAALHTGGSITSVEVAERNFDESVGIHGTHRRTTRSEPPYDGAVGISAWRMPAYSRRVFVVDALSLPHPAAGPTFPACRIRRLQSRRGRVRERPSTSPASAWLFAAASAVGTAAGSMATTSYARDLERAASVRCISRSRSEQSCAGC
jgi:hypothetical protein